MNSENDLGPSSTKDKPIIATGPVGHPHLAQLPEWPARTIAVLSTINGGPHQFQSRLRSEQVTSASSFRWNAPGVRWLACVRTQAWRSRSSPAAIALSQHSAAPASSKN